MEELKRYIENLDKEIKQTANSLKILKREFADLTRDVQDLVIKVGANHGNNVQKQKRGNKD